ncbi:MAG: right-handed parallel beta-helix repeat-containing protein [Chthoniobacterales bacterium]
MAPAESSSFIIRVGPEGSDRADGSTADPLLTLEAAKEKIRSLLSSEHPPARITVKLEPGEYRLQTPFILEADVLGSATHSIEWIGDETHRPVLTGGVRLQEWTAASDGYWHCSVPGGLPVRQLYQQDCSLPRAGYAKLSKAQLSWKKFPLQETDTGEILVKNVSLEGVRPEDRLELLWMDDFRAHWIPVAVMPGGTGLFPQPGPISIAIGNNKRKAGRFSAGSRLENALGMISPGEWYFSPAQAAIIYAPKPGEKIETFRPEIPVSAALLIIQGNGTPAHLRISGIHWRLASWDDPQQRAFVSNQSGVSWIASNRQARDYDASHSARYLQIIPAAIRIEKTSGVHFENNVIDCVGGVGLSIGAGCSDAHIEGNAFLNTGADAITVGSPIHPETDPSMPPCRDIHISDNLIRRTGHTFPSTAAITAYYMQQSVIEHNDLADLPYTGISIGWGWNHRPEYSGSGANRVTGNRVARYMSQARDGGAIYTLGPQPGSVCQGNYLLDGLSTGVFGAIYHDMGSSGWRTTENVIEKTHSWLDLHEARHIIATGNFSDQPRWVDHGIECDVRGNLLEARSQWPARAREIVANAGIRPERKTSAHIFASDSSPTRFQSN